MTTQRFERLDFGGLQKPKKMANGTVKVDAYLTRTGVFPYLQQDGSIRRELRHPDDVFNADSIESLSMAVLTLDHPTVPVTVNNAKSYGVGHVGDVSVNQNKLQAPVMVTDASAVEDLMSGRKKEVSCGYWCDLEDVQGVYNGERYDARQRNITYNHAALVARGRAGPEVAVRIDRADTGVMINDEAEVRTDAAISWQRAHPEGTPKQEPGTPWDGPEQVRLANTEEQLVRMMTWVDSGANPESKGSYKLPHHTAAGAVNLNGVRAALAALNGARGGVNIPANDVAGVRAHLERHLREDFGITEDSADFTVDTSTDKGKPMAKTIKVDSVTFEVEGQLHEALTAKFDAHSAEVEALEASQKDLGNQVQTEKARADAAEEKLAEVEAKLDAAVSPEAVAAAVSARVALETIGKDALGDEFNSDASDEDIKRAVVLKVSPSAAEKLDGCSDAYLNARFDAAVEGMDSAKAKQDAAEDSVAALNVATKQDAAPQESKLDAAIRRRREKDQAAAAQPLTVSLDRAPQHVTTQG